MITVALAIDRTMCVQTYCFRDGREKKKIVSTHTHVNVGPDGGNLNIYAQINMFSIRLVFFFFFLICKIVFACRLRRD